jgi:sulfur dioxygenase
LLLDPVLEQKDRDLALVDELGLTLQYVVNTHCHADHITSGAAIRQERPEVRTVISRASGAKADMHVEEGDRIVIEEGVIELEVLATPGHTSGCVCFFLRSSGASENSKLSDLLFTGDTLLIRGCGRTDFQQGSSNDLYRNVHSKLFTLDEGTLVYPGHDYKGRTVSSIGEEKEYNPRLTKSESEFSQLMAELGLPYPKKIDVALPANLQCGVQDI